MAAKNVCLVGAGNIANTHAAVLATLPSVAVSTVVDPNLALAEAMAKSLGGAKAFASLDDALAAGGFDRAHILVPPPLRDPIATKLLNAGVSVLCEKPLAETSAECGALIQLAASKGVTLGVNQNCPSSKHLGHLSLFVNGGFGSSGFDVKPLGVDGSSGGF